MQKNHILYIKQIINENFKISNITFVITYLVGMNQVFMIYRQ